LWSSGKAAIGLDRKLKSHRSTGDLNKMMAINHDPHEDALHSQSDVTRLVSPVPFDRGAGQQSDDSTFKAG